jgi:hypothetical protein
MQMNRAYAVGCLGWGKSRLNSRWKNASRYKYVISAPRVRENRWSALEKNVAGLGPLDEMSVAASIRRIDKKTFP